MLFYSTAGPYWRYPYNALNDTSCEKVLLNDISTNRGAHTAKMAALEKPLMDASTSLDASLGVCTLSIAETFRL